MNTEQHAVYLFFAAFFLLYVSIAVALVLQRRVSFLAILLAWLCSIGVFAFFYAYALTYGCDCSLIQVIELSCTSCLLGWTNNLIQFAALVAALTLAVPLAGLVALRSRKSSP